MFIKVLDNQIASENYTFEQLRQDYPDRSFPSDFFEHPELLEGYNVFLVVVEPPPINNDEWNYAIIANPIALINGVWTRTFSLVERSEQDKISLSESEGDWNNFNFGLAAITGFSAWKNTVEVSTDSMYFEILRGALINRNITGMQAAYDAISLLNKPPKTMRTALQNLANDCHIRINFLLVGD